MAVISASDADFAQHLAAHPRVVVKYYADWCGSCKLIAPKFKRLAEDPAYEGTLFLEVNAETSPEARAAAGVTNLPTFATFLNGQKQWSDYTAKMETVQEQLAHLTPAS